MAEQKKGTVYQDLNRFLNLDPLSFDQASTGNILPQQPKKIIIKGNSPEEIYRKGLELEQKKKIQDAFYRTTDRGFQKALQYEAGRIQAYMDYEGAEYYPIIASALDLFMEEATTIGIDGKMLNIHSNKERIKLELEDLFYNVINVNVNLPFWTRNLPVKDDSMIPLLNGEIITIKEISDRLKNNPNEDIWTYAIQDKTHNIVTGKIIWCDLTRENSEILRVYFDNENYIETAPDHEFMLRNGNYKRADELNINDSLMPFYTSISKENNNLILNHKVLRIERLETTHDVYCMEVVGPNNEQDRHNFAVCGRNESGDYQRDGVFVSNCKYGDNFCFLYGERNKGITAVRQLVNYEIERFERVINGKMNIKFKERMTGDEFETFQMAHFRLLGDDKMIPYGSSLLNKVRRVFRMLVMAEDAMLTYRLLRAGDKRVYKIDVGNLDEDDVDEYLHKVMTKFKKMPQIDPNNGQIDYRFNIVGNDEDIILPVRNANTLTGVETLQGASNLNQIADIEYLRDQLFTGLGIAKPFLSFQDATGGGKNMAQFDIRFSKKVNRIQQAMIQELNKIAIIHLYYLGHSPEDLNNFTLTLTNPSTQQEQLKSELFQTKAQTYTELTRAEGGISAMSHTNAKRKLFNMSDKEIVDDLRQQKIEKVIMQEFADSPVAIKKTGLFADIDKRYGESVNNIPTSGATGGAPAGGEMGGIGGGLPPMGGGPSGGLPPMNNEPFGGPSAGGEIPEPIAGLPNQSPSDLPPIKESRAYPPKRGFDDYVNELVYGNTQEGELKKERVRIIMETDEKIIDQNTKTNDLILEMDEMLERGINIIRDTDDIENEIDIESISEADIIENEKISDL